MGWNPTPSSLLKCIGVLGLLLKSVPDPGMEPHTPQSLEMHWGLGTLSKMCSQPWDGTPHPPVIEMHWGLGTLSKKCSRPWDGTPPSSLLKCIGVSGLCLKIVLDPGMEPHTPQSLEMYWGLGTLSKKCSRPWDGTSHPPVIGNALGSRDSV